MEEATVKVFDPRVGKKGNGAIARKMIRHTAAIARKSRLPVITCFSTEQSGDNFGERLANAIEATFAQGYTHIIAIGNDCPAISVSLLQDAAQQLEAGNLVLGPALDGGVYLIGMTTATYDRARFIALPWQQENLQPGWAQYADELQNEVTWLIRQADIDHAEDFRKVLLALPTPDRLRQQLLSILASSQTTHIQAPKPIQATFLSKALLLRGPPA